MHADLALALLRLTDTSTTLVPAAQGAVDITVGSAAQRLGAPLPAHINHRTGTTDIGGA